MNGQRLELVVRSDGEGYRVDRVNDSSWRIWPGSAVLGRGDVGVVKANDKLIHDFMVENDSMKSWLKAAAPIFIRHDQCKEGKETGKGPVRLASIAYSAFLLSIHIFHVYVHTSLLLAMVVNTTLYIGRTPFKSTPPRSCTIAARLR